MHPNSPFFCGEIRVQAGVLGGMGADGPEPRGRGRLLAPRGRTVSVRREPPPRNYVIWKDLLPKPLLPYPLTLQMHHNNFQNLLRFWELL